MLGLIAIAVVFTCLICLMGIVVGRMIAAGDFDDEGEGHVVSLDLERARRNRDRAPAA